MIGRITISELRERPDSHKQDVRVIANEDGFGVVVDANTDYPRWLHHGNGKFFTARSLDTVVCGLHMAGVQRMEVQLEQSR